MNSKRITQQYDTTYNNRSIYSSNCSLFKTRTICIDKVKALSTYLFHATDNLYWWNRTRMCVLDRLFFRCRNCLYWTDCFSYFTSNTKLDQIKSNWIGTFLYHRIFSLHRAYSLEFFVYVHMPYMFAYKKQINRCI